MTARENVQAFLEMRATMTGIDSVIHSVNGVPLTTADLTELCELAWMFEELQS